MFPQSDEPEDAEFMTIVESTETFEVAGIAVHRIVGTFMRPYGEDPLRLPVYVSDEVLGGYRPSVGDRIEGVMWLQGRLAG